MHTTDEPDSGGLDPALVAEVDRVSQATIDAWTDPDRIARERAVVRAAIDPGAVTEAEAAAMQRELHEDAQRQLQGSSPSVAVVDEGFSDPEPGELERAMQSGTMGRYDGGAVFYTNSPVPQRSAVDQAHGEIRASVAATSQHLGTGSVQLERRPDPETIDPLTVQRVCARVGKRTLYDGPVTAAAGEMLAQLQAHGRQLRVTCWMVDGTKRIYRGNGVRIR